MKKLVLLIACLSLLFGASAQVSINSDGSQPNPSAMLEVKSTDKGFLPPRMTTTQMNGIITPPEGLLVYNTSVNALYWFNGTTWKKFNDVSFTETDPVFAMHISSGITATDVNNWNMAYGWGNHATAGYLTTYTETDPLFYSHPASSITSILIAQWNTAYNTRITGVSSTSPLSLSLTGNQITGSMTTANAVTAGYITPADWNTFNNKQNALIFGNVTSADMTITGGTGSVVGAGVSLAINKGSLIESGSSVLTITGGSNAVLGTGATIQVKQAGNAQSGFLSSDDWNTFNSKQNSLTTGNLTSPDIAITGGTGSVIGSGTTLTVNKGTLSSTDLTVTGGTNAVLGSGATLAVKKGNLTETGSSVLNITNGTNAVLGTAGTTLQVKQAGTSQSGYLSSTDWNVFNNKQNALTFGNLTSSDITVTGGAGVVKGSGTSLIINKGDLISSDIAITGGTGAVLGSGAALSVKKANLTETGSSVLTITNGSNAVLGESGTTVQVRQAGSSQSGYLSNNDWNSFNNKVSSQWVSNAQDISYNDGKVGVGTSSPAPSAIVEMSTTTAGVLIPRMTLDQRNAIVAPAEGLMVFCLDCGTKGSLSIYSGGSWNTFSPCTSPSPVAAFHSLSPGKIVWNWLAAPGSLGFKWGTTPSYTQAIDMGSLTSKTETGVECDTTYNRYLWTYNACGVSDPIVLSQAISSATPDAPTVGTHTATQTSITWNWNFVPGATGYKWSTVNDFSTAIDKGNSNNHTETGDTCATEYMRFLWAYNGCGYSLVDTLTHSTLSCWACGFSNLTINHLMTGGVAPVNKTTSYGTVIGITGEPLKCWITSNLGSDHQAISVDDITEASAGWYWQFNHKQGYKEDGTGAIPSWTITWIDEDSDWLPSNDPCNIELGSAWRLPTNTEWNNVITGNAWSDWNGPWNSGLKLHAAGTLYNTNGGRHDQGSRGVYWAGTQFNTVRGYYMNFSSSYCNMNTPFKSDGINIRCVSDNCLTINNPSQGSHIQTTNQIIWNWTSVSGAAGYKWNTTNDYASATDMGTATSKTETGLTCNTPYTRYAWAYNECGASSPVTLTQSTLACSGGFTCGQSLTINHVAGDVAPVSKNTTYGTVTGIPGEPTKCWITSNLGSDHQATAVDDATEASAGWYWQFNRKQGYKHDGTTRTPNTAWITSINENLDWQTANDPCSMELGSQWRLPTNIEWINVDGSGGWAYWNGPWDSSLKLHAAGGLNGLDGSLFSRGSTGNYWSSTQGITDYGQILFISSGNSSMSNGLKVCAYSVRCLRDN